ncbi:MAG: molybdenum cofactor biosynthesis protein [Solirubrobacteraceae bacterium]
MRVQVRLFAGLRERAGADRLYVDLDDGAVVADLLRELDWLAGDVRALLAVNREYAQPSTPLSEGDELALIPPVSGGSGDDGRQPGHGSSTELVHVQIRAAPLEAEAISQLVRDPRAGAVVTFQGVTRDVPFLEYEAYTEMALAKIREIAEAAHTRHGLCRVAVEHRSGTVALSEPSVVIAVSAPHRDAAFTGAREIIDALKLSVPIWKREGDGWVGQ